MFKRTHEAQRSALLKVRYGITFADYDAMLMKQDGRCAICRKPPKGRYLHVDHDHETGAVRGLLCARCNTALGHINDDKNRLLGLIEYLELSSA